MIILPYTSNMLRKTMTLVDNGQFQQDCDFLSELSHFSIVSIIFTHRRKHFDGNRSFRILVFNLPVQDKSY